MNLSLPSMYAHVERHQIDTWRAKHMKLAVPHKCEYIFVIVLGEPRQKLAMHRNTDKWGWKQCSMQTGWGRSFVYFIATKLLREAGAGPALLISPLLALMRNQIAAAERMSVRAVTVNSDNQAEWATVEAMLQRNEVDILLISPERLANERFSTEVLARVAGRTALLVIDEAHLRRGCCAHMAAARCSLWRSR